MSAQENWDKVYGIKYDDPRWLTSQYYLSFLNWDGEIRQQFDLPSRVYFHDVTLREGEQTPHVSLLPQEKTEIARRLDQLGVHSIEIAPFYSEWDFEATKELVSMRKKGELKAKVIALCRWREADVDIAMECGVDGVMVEGGINPYLLKVGFGLDEKSIVETLTRVVKYAKDHGLFTVGEPWDIYRTPLRFVEQVAKSLVFEGGADHISISDTQGSALPWTITHVVKKLKKWIPNTPIEHHAHNDFGLATATMIAAVVGGASVVHTCINGLGERAGNAATEEVAIAIQLLLGVDAGLKLEHLYPTCEFVAELAKVPVPTNKAVTGINEFVTGSSMVAWSYYYLSKAGLPTTVFTPELIGRKKTDVYSEALLGRGAGAFTIAERLKKLGLDATKEQVEEIVKRVKTEAGIRKWSLPDTAFELIAKQVLSK